MKKLLASALAVTFVLGAAQGANANWFWRKDDNAKSQNYQSQSQTRIERPVAYRTRSPEQEKWVYSGNNAYPTIAGQMAVEDRMNDGDNTAFIVHPVRNSQFNGSLRQGDTGQSAVTRVNQTFNN